MTHSGKSSQQTLPNAPDGESGIQTTSVTYPIHTGGGWYELSNGEKVQGKEEAQQAEDALRGGE